MPYFCFFAKLEGTELFKATDNVAANTQEINSNALLITIA
jgi:hypothetical protein